MKVIKQKSYQKVKFLDIKTSKKMEKKNIKKIKKNSMENDLNELKVQMNLLEKIQVKILRNHLLLGLKLPLSQIQEKNIKNNLTK